MTLSPARRAELIDLAATLGRERFAPRAAQHDLDATFPFENYDDLRRYGLLGLCVPAEHGGLGADFESYCLVAAEIGRHCGATALTFNMHSVSMLWSSGLVDDLDLGDDDRAAHDERRRYWYRRVLDDGAIFAQPFSEPESGAASGRHPFATQAVPVEGGWRVSGRKHFASLSGAADYYSVTCTQTADGAPTEGAGTGGADGTLFLIIPGGADGFSISGTWDPVGMRATVSRVLEFDEVFVPERNQLMPRGAYRQAARRWPHMFVTLTPAYMGIARAAFDFTVAYLRGEVDGGPSEARRDSPIKQLAVADMRLKLDQADALWRTMLGEAGVDPTGEQRLRMFSAQYTVMEHCNDICRLAIRTCGGRSIMRSLPLERLYRDSRCGSLMLPYTAEISLERLGVESLF
ncbi:MAG: acyl-CoA dehydrogenase family protein [Acidimicrobiales bacterium]